MKQFAGRLQSEIVTAMGASVPQLLSQAIGQLNATTAREDDCYLIITKSVSRFARNVKDFLTAVHEQPKQRETEGRSFSFRFIYARLHSDSPLSLVCFP